MSYHELYGIHCLEFLSIVPWAQFSPIDKAMVLDAVTHNQLALTYGEAFERAYCGKIARLIVAENPEMEFSTSSKMLTVSMAKVLPFLLERLKLGEHQHECYARLEAIYNAHRRACPEVYDALENWREVWVHDLLSDGRERDFMLIIRLCWKSRSRPIFLLVS